MPSENVKFTHCGMNIHASERESLTQVFPGEMAVPPPVRANGDIDDAIRWEEVKQQCGPFSTFRQNADCKDWMTKLISFVASKLGETRTTRMHSYISGGGIYLAIDIFSDKGEEYISITALMSKNEICLTAPQDGQFDISLPNIVDGFFLASALLSTNQNLPTTGHPLFVYLPDRRVA